MEGCVKRSWDCLPCPSDAADFFLFPYPDMVEAEERPERPLGEREAEIDDLGGVNGDSALVERLVRHHGAGDCVGSGHGKFGCSG